MNGLYSLFASLIFAIAIFGCKRPAADNSSSTDNPSQIKTSLDGKAALVEPNNSFAILPIKDQKVNTGSLPALSETLEVKIKTIKAIGAVTYNFQISPPIDDPKIIEDTFLWKPGSYKDGEYSNQQGSYKVTIQAKDESGLKASVSFAVEVVLIEYVNYGLEGASDEGDSQLGFEIHEKLHPERQYFLDEKKDNMLLLKQTCRSFVQGKASITFERPLQITRRPTSKSDDKSVHAFKIYYPKVKGGAPFKEMIFIIPIFVYPDPDKSISSLNKAPGLFFKTFHTRCEDWEVPPKQCDLNVLNKHGMENFFYCSDYIPNGETFETYSLSIYCQYAGFFNLSKQQCDN